MRVSSPVPHKKARIEIIPLIDIMFFLLASFMMVSLSQVHMKGMKVNLPTGQSGETQSKKDYISVSVHFNIIRVLDILRSVGFYKVAFEIKSEALKGVPGGGR